MDRVLLDRDGAVARLTFNRPEVVNATDPLFLEGLLGVAKELARDRTTRVVLVTGAGRGFCSGIDLKALSRREIKRPSFRRWEEALRLFETLYDKAVVCGIHGACIGGGLQFALACDMRIAADDAFFSLTAVRHSIIPGLGTFRLPRSVGLTRGRLLSLMATRVGAHEARAWGLVDRVVARSDLSLALHEAAETFLQTAPTAFRETKKVLLEAFDLPFARFLGAYLKGQDACLRSADHTVAGDAYLARTAPRFESAACREPVPRAAKRPKAGASKPAPGARRK
jgi:enoyl-CoA hydratase/carnithine racemase